MILATARCLSWNLLAPKFRRLDHSIEETYSFEIFP